MATIPNIINAELTDEQLEAIRGMILATREALPMQESLTPEQRKRMVKMGQSMVGFVQQALSLADSDDSYLPRIVSVDNFRRDVKLTNQLQEIRIELTRLMEILDDNYLAASSEAYKTALVVYQAAKSFGPEEVQPVVKDMARMFSSGASATGEAPETAETDQG